MEQPLLGGRLSSRDERRIGRVVVILLVALLVVLALSPGGQANIIRLASKGTGIALLLLVPLCGPLLWPGASRAGAISALIVGLLFLGVVEIGIARLELPLGFGPPVAALLLQFPVFLLGSLIFPRERMDPRRSGNSTAGTRAVGSTQ